jgi:hypothetical protein
MFEVTPFSGTSTLAVHDGVEHEFAEILVAPQMMEVTAGETEAARAVVIFHGPRECLRHAVRKGLAHRGIAAARAVVAQ